MRAQPVADHLFPSTDGGLGPGAFRVPGRPLPGHAPVLGDVLEVAVALRRIVFSRLARHGARARRHDDLRLGVALGDAGVSTVLIVRAIGRERDHRPRHLVEQGTGLGAVIDVVGGQCGGDDLAGVGVHAEMQMLWGRRRGDGTIVAVIEMSQSSWLVAGVVPGIARHPLKKLAPDQDALLSLLHRWREEAGQAGRDGFWLARWLRAHGIEAHVIHPTSMAVSREHRRAKTDRLDTALLKRVFLGWLRGEPEHCHMAAIPTLADEDAKRPTRERECLVGERTRIVNRIKAALVRLGVRGFKPTLRKALEHLDALRTPEGTALPPNTRAELHRDMARLHVVTEQ